MPQETRASYQADPSLSCPDLSPEAKILYSSDSIVDILGYTPDEVVNKSCWEFFHPEEIPYARDFHNRGVKTDKAAVLAYCQIKDSEGRWVGCECCFTIVYDVMVVCTSIYRYGMTSQSMHTRFDLQPVKLTCVSRASQRSANSAATVFFVAV